MIWKCFNFNFCFNSFINIYMLCCDIFLNFFGYYISFCWFFFMMNKYNGNMNLRIKI